MIDKEQDAMYRADEAVPHDDAAASATTPPVEASTREAEHARIMAIARKVMRDHREVLAALAK